MRKYLLILVLLSIVQIAAPNSSIASSAKEDNLRSLNTIQECKMIATAGRLNSSDERRIAGLLSSFYSSYTRSFIAFDSVSLLKTTSPTDLESAYQKSLVDKKLDIFHELIRFLPVLKKFKSIKVYEAEMLDKSLQEVLQSSETLDENASSFKDLQQLYLAYWRLRFIEPYQGVKSRLDMVDKKIKSFEGAQTEEKEFESIKSALNENINQGQTDAYLEQRIAKLPESKREAIEDLRNKLLEEKATQVKKVQEDKEKKEKSLQKQIQINQAIKWRKEEIDTGKLNLKAQEQRKKDQEINQAIELWEMHYKKELATKKADEAERRIAEIERAKIEKQRKKEADEVKKKKMEEENILRAKLEKYNVRTSVLGDELYANPFQWEGQNIVLTGARFERMIERKVAIFSTYQNNQIVISKLPSDLFTRKGQTAELIVKVKGKASGTNLLGAKVEVPHVEYISIFP